MGLLIADFEATPPSSQPPSCACEARQDSSTFLLIADFKTRPPSSQPTNSVGNSTEQTRPDVTNTIARVSPRNPCGVLASTIEIGFESCPLAPASPWVRSTASNRVP